MLSLVGFYTVLGTISIVWILTRVIRRALNWSRNRPDRAWKASGYTYRYKVMDDSLRIKTQEQRKVLEQHIRVAKRMAAQGSDEKATVRSIRRA